MDYPLENLGPERFQLFCQSLISREYPRVQCFPVAQPDGGRDAISYLWESAADKFLVFQVKYARNPFAETDPRKWLMTTMEDELAKVRELIPRGASEYILVTNVPGTAHLDAGSIDRLNKELSESLGLHSLCWWRNDVNRRLDDAWSLKWTYPELMTGPDFLRWVVESGLSEHRERRTSTIRAFLRTQYDMDEEVRFKQVELQNKLLDLFIDVPISFRGHLADVRQLQAFYSSLRRSLPRDAGLIEDFEGEAATRMIEGGLTWTHHHEQIFEAATLLLSDVLQTALPRVVVEGAPGQGKSTIAQYICQVHRMRLLQENEVLLSIPLEHRKSPCRLPIKIDLRDLAMWMGKKDPFNADGQNSPPKKWHKSLEAFLSGLISHQSGGMDFTTDDLVAVLRISSILLVFDGLDEVADIARRQEIVDEIVHGVQRLEENAASLQVIVTSRPAAFANSPGMPHGKYFYLQLLSLSRPLIMQYAERWLRARRLGTTESGEFRRILKEKLDQPHLRDLARNPMQLAILLSLVLTRGASLPDKRTALYDYYIDLFFSREAEKSPVVRDHRELLINIHRFLGWMLHSEAELEGASGSIAQDKLLRVVTDYLSKEGHDTKLANDLFAGMVERVVALVSRVEGTFEFEVQPLREYFAACHLYYTAPQSSPGKEKPGSKPDRFDVIARNFYWLNVTRFYAGCYSKGELPSLVERLQELTRENGFRSIAHPRILASTLLADWVFAQNPKSVRELIDLLFDPIGIRYLLSQSTSNLRVHANSGLVLSPKCGRDELIQRAFELLNQKLPPDFQSDIIAVLRSNSESAKDFVSRWLEAYRGQTKSEDSERWMKHGEALGVLSVLEINTLNELIGESGADLATLGILFQARRLDYIQHSEFVFETAVSEILECKINLALQVKVESALDALGAALQPYRYALAFRERQPIPLEKIVRNHEWIADLKWPAQSSNRTESYKSYLGCMELARAAEAELKRDAVEWATKLDPWDRVVEAGRAIWGDRWAFSVLANIASGIRSSSEQCQVFTDLLDHSRSLTRRTRYARLRSGNTLWWKKQFEAALTVHDKMMIALIALTWMTNNNLVDSIDSLELIVGKLSHEEWRQLFYGVRRANHLTQVREERRERLEIDKLPANLSERMASLIALRADATKDQVFFTKYFDGSRRNDPMSLEFVLQEALDLSQLGTKAWNPRLDIVQKCYELGVVFEPTEYRVRVRALEPKIVSIDLANRIVNDADKYPDFLVHIAERRCTEAVARKITPVLQVADREKWFVST